jgi:hypothetical protein
MQSIAWLLAAAGLVQQPPVATDPRAIVAAPAVPTAGPVLVPAFPSYSSGSVVLAVDSGSRRPAAIEYSELYGVRLAVHRYASYATIPLFVAEYAIGRSLYNRPGASESLRSAHGAVAGAVAGLFVVNTVTGVWNLWDSRRDPAGRTRRYIHAALMLAADAGFAWTGALAPDDDEGGLPSNAGRRNMHRTVAISSMSVALLGYGMMLLWKD